MTKLLPLFLLLAAALVGWLYWQQSRPQPLVVSGLIEADEIRVGSRVGGRASEVLVSEGQAVRTGDALFKLDPFDLREHLAEAEAQLEAAKAVHARLKAGYRTEEIEQARARRDRAAATLAKLQAGPRPHEIEIARERLKMAGADLELAQIEHQRYMSLRQQDEAAQMEYDRSVRALKSAQAAEAAAREELALLEEGTRAEDINEARAVLAEAEQSLKLFEVGFRAEETAEGEARVAAAKAAADAIGQRIKELTVVAPCDCTVEAIDLRPGDLVAAGAPTVSLLDVSAMWVRAYVPESRLGALSIGAIVPFRVDGFPAERFRGKVTFVAREGEFTPKNIQTPEERSKQVFRIKVTVIEGREKLRVGMTADLFLDEATAP